MNRRILGILFVMGDGLWMGMTLSQAQVLLEINDSDPNTIIFTATTNSAATTTYDFGYVEGIDQLPRQSG